MIQGGSRPLLAPAFQGIPDNERCPYLIRLLAAGAMPLGKYQLFRFDPNSAPRCQFRPSYPFVSFRKPKIGISPVILKCDPVW